MSTEYITKRIYTVEIEKSQYIKLRDLIAKYEKQLNAARNRYHKINDHKNTGEKRVAVPQLKVISKRTDKFKVCLEAVDE